MNSKSEQNLDLGSIEEILEAHKPLTVGHVHCNCREIFTTDKKHRAHIAKLINEHVRRVNMDTANEIRTMFNGTYSSFDDKHSINRDVLEVVIAKVGGLNITIDNVGGRS